MEASSARAPQIVLGTKKELPTQRLAARNSMKFSPASMIALINQTRHRTVAEFAAAGARKFSQSENRQRCDPPTPISTLTFFRSWGSSASTRWAPRTNRCLSTKLAAGIQARTRKTGWNDSETRSHQ